MHKYKHTKLYMHTTNKNNYNAILQTTQQGDHVDKEEGPVAVKEISRSDEAVRAEAVEVVGAGAKSEAEEVIWPEAEVEETVGAETKIKETVGAEVEEVVRDEAGDEAKAKEAVNKYEAVTRSGRD